MLQLTSTPTTALVGVALASLPILVGTQSMTTPRPTPTLSSSSQPSSTADEATPQHHLAEARKVLDSIQVQGEGRTQIGELRQHFSRLETAWLKQSASAAHAAVSRTGHAGGHTGSTTTTTGGTTSGAPGAAAAGTTGRPEQAGATGAAAGQTTRSGATTVAGDHWITHYQAIDKMLDQLLGDTSAGAATGSTTATIGTTGAAKVALNAETQAKLSEFRSYIDLFHAAVTQSGATGSMTMPSAPASVSVERAEIARLAAQIDELIGRASTSSTSATAAPGAVGTSGTSGATGTVCVDRARLEQLKRDIQALQR